MVILCVESVAAQVFYSTKYSKNACIESQKVVEKTATAAA